MRNLKFAYVTTFLLIAILSTLKLATVLVLTQQEGVTQRYVTLLSDQAVHSQRLQRNALFLLIPGDHRKTVQDLQADLQAIEKNHRTFQTTYANFLVSSPQLKALSVKGKPAYTKMIAAAHSLIALEANTKLAAKARYKAELPYITTIFYNEDVHLSSIQQTFVIINAQAEAYVAQVQALFYINYGLTILVLAAEGWLVLRPALRSFHKLEMEEEETPHDNKQPLSTGETA